MADGILCKHCGWNEADHSVFSNKRKGANCNFSLDNCPGYVPEDPGLAERLEHQAAQDAVDQALKLAGLPMGTPAE